ncbi:epoxide hydrolase [Trifolium pratense]|uniref:Epoxide hydrolase n=1 Tax=Trifolium pratense TaxID=57577 RepID=A0A2K3LMZ8_TRIPR|nr:epoxide hydrolase [Trifolium pratense]
MLTSRSPKPPILPKEGLLSHPNVSSTKALPSWLSQEDITYYASKFEKSGFTGGLNYYRNLNLFEPGSGMI